MQRDRRDSYENIHKILMDSDSDNASRSSSDSESTSNEHADSGSESEDSIVENTIHNILHTCAEMFRHPKQFLHHPSTSTDQQEEKASSSFPRRKSDLPKNDHVELYNRRKSDDLEAAPTEDSKWTPSRKLLRRKSHSLDSKTSAEDSNLALRRSLRKKSEPEITSPLLDSQARGSRNSMVVSKRIRKRRKSEKESEKKGGFPFQRVIAIIIALLKTPTMKKAMKSLTEGDIQKIKTLLRSPALRKLVEKSTKTACKMKYVKKGLRRRRRKASVLDTLVD